MTQPVKRSPADTSATKRPYDSSRRRARAAESRRQILSTALDLFVAQGYGKTSLAQVAAGAGVSVETLYAEYGNKATLLRKVWFFEARGDDSGVTLYERPEVQAILAEPDLRVRHERYAVVVAAFHRRMSPLLDMITGAAASEPGAAEMVDTFATRRLDVATGFAEAAARTGQLAVPTEEYRDVMFVALRGDLWRELVIGRGWTDQRYASWLAGLWNAQVASEGQNNSP